MRIQQWASSSVVTVLAIGYLSLVVVRAFGEDGGGWAEVLAFVPILAVSVLAGVSLAVGYSYVSSARLRRVAIDHPDAATFTAEMTPALKLFLQSKRRTIVESKRTRIPHFHTVVASEDGLSFWRGWPRNPSQFFFLDWAAISDMQAEVVQLQFKKTQGLRLTTFGDGAFDIVPYSSRWWTGSCEVKGTARLIEAIIQQWSGRRRAVQPNAD